jgi:phosphate transport system substrate-binding protein
MNNGVCTNLPSLCSKAASKESIVMSTPDARCPECNASLMVAGGNSRNATNTKLIISVLVGLLVLALGAFFFSRAIQAGRRPLRVRAPRHRSPRPNPICCNSACPARTRLVHPLRPRWWRPS